MGKISNDIERVVGSAAKALTALQDLAADLDMLNDIGENEAVRLSFYRFMTDYAITQASDIWGWLASLYEAAAWIEEEEIAEQCQK
ncbi:hypothetical protein [Gleimia europaea]|uniref:hypothetical protein n=1 Tax=Gleimia europaea TaxID=66228 RepID=UPI000C7F8EB8|nr:hypothetical protein [Gleimia europaea]WIK62589.1 hypothetical protein CJ185_008750 [Gleimia europaea]